MSREELRYRGPLDLGDGIVHQTEVWGVDSTLVAFEGGNQLAVMQAAVIGATDDRRIDITGTSDGAPAEWLGPDPERIIVQFGGAKIAWPDGSTWTAATVAQSQYGAAISVGGHAPRFLPGARVEMVGNQRWIVDGATRILAEVGRRGCGCGQ